ncbi:MAG: hypothetical protein DCE90_13995 [Pseudanabaena sp.]|nr:MAG: hypothetical protein DCE90_13995 [Pseudanabaena sp.]
MELTLTQGQAETIIYNLCFTYTTFGDPVGLNTANYVAIETGNLQYFNGIVRGLNIIFPIPVEPTEPTDP